MKIGDRVVISKRRTRGAINFYDCVEKKGIIIQKYPNFYVVRLDKGYNECFRKEELSKEK